MDLSLAVLFLIIQPALFIRLDVENTLVKDFEDNSNFEIPFPNIRYNLYNDPKYPNQQKNLDNENPKIKNYNGGKVVFLIHGFKDYKSTSWMSQVRILLLQKKLQKANIIELFWDSYSTREYEAAASSTTAIGVDLSRVIYKLAKNSNVALDDVLLIGFCMGGHIAGVAGKNIKSRMQQEISRIIALDPARPIYDKSSQNNKLSQTDANIVSVLHTSAGVYGFEEPLGDIDIYPNGGYFQLICSKYLNETDPYEAVKCNHEYSFELFIEGLQNRNITATKCNSYGEFLMNMCSYDVTIPVSDLDTEKTGKFYLDTLAIDSNYLLQKINHIH